jgi:hypothetical protein
LGAVESDGQRNSRSLAPGTAARSGLLNDDVYFSMESDTRGGDLFAGTPKLIETRNYFE